MKIKILPQPNHLVSNFYPHLSLFYHHIITHNLPFTCTVVYYGHSGCGAINNKIFKINSKCDLPYSTQYQKILLKIIYKYFCDISVQIFKYYVIETKIHGILNYLVQDLSFFKTCVSLESRF